jgi:hypothetical protein
LAETTAARDIAGTTAKAHLEHIFLKTVVTRQAELMRLWTGLICCRKQRSYSSNAFTATIATWRNTSAPRRRKRARRCRRSPPKP